MAARMVPGEDVKFLQKEGLTAEVQPSEDGAHTDGSPGTFEWWYFDATLKDGSGVFVQFGTKHFLEPGAELTPLVQVGIGKGSDMRSGRDVRSADEYSASPGSCDVRIGPSWVTGDLHTYRLHAEAGDLAADLTFTRIVPSWRPGAGRIYFDPGGNLPDEKLDTHTGWLAPIPLGTVKGTLTYDGEPHEVEGLGYHDHNWGNLDPATALAGWYWGRTYIKDYTVIFARVDGNATYGSAQVPIFMLAQGNRILAESGRPSTIKTGAEVEDDTTGLGYPRWMNVEWQAWDGQIKLRIERPKVIAGTPIEVEPEYLWPESSWLLPSAEPDDPAGYLRLIGPASLDVHLEDTQGVGRGTALFEMMDYPDPPSAT